MDQNAVIVITGAAGFIGSCMVQYLNDQGYVNLVLVDNFDADVKLPNWKGKKYLQTIPTDKLEGWLYDQAEGKVDAIIHLGACTDTTEFDYAIHNRLNVEYSKMLWSFCALKHIPFIYASSAATYGAGELGYNDDHHIIESLTPLNPYGISKNEFDKWALQQKQQQPIAWAGLKFFNVYGPNEYHKGRMASMVWHSFNQINATGQVRLFKSHRTDFKDGEQLRDFVYVIDLLKVMFWMMTEMLKGKWDAPKNGLYNLGTGKARSFYDLAVSTFKGMDKEPNIVFIDMPEDIRDKYQYFTEADMHKLHTVGYTTPFYSLEEGVDNYVRNYLTTRNYY